jgi:serine phosphatase RsbU (regulator of sigma subunit)
MALHLSTTLNGETRTWPLEGSAVRIGRGSGNHVQLLDATVSKEHAELAEQAGRWSIRDLGSRNGTRVNGRDASSPLPVVRGDRIEIGHVVLQVEEAGRAGGSRVVTSEHVGSSLRLNVKELLERPTASEASASRVLHLLAEAGQLLVLPRPLAETCEAILGFIEKAVRANRLVVLLRDPQTGELTQVAARYRGGRASEPLALSQSITRAVLAENTAVITADAANDPRFLAQHSIIAQAIHSAMAVPLFDNEQVLGILYVDTSDPVMTYGQPELELLTLLGNMAAVKITNARLLEQEQVRQRMAQELATATRIQRNLLPQPPAIPGWCFHARIETCHEVGGDLFDFHVRDDGHIIVLVGDVSGKGMGAALLMSSTLSSARVLYDECEGPLELVRRLNSILCRGSDGRSFVTLFAGCLDPASGRLRYVNAGHPEPHVARAGRSRTLEATGIPVGMLSSFTWQEMETTLEPGDLLVLFSDGIPEAQREGEFFDTERVTAAVLAAEAEPSVERAADAIIARIDEFAAGEHRADDVTLVLLRRE